MYKYVTDSLLSILVDIYPEVTLTDMLFKATIIQLFNPLKYFKFLFDIQS